jgi:cytochrome b subunit of formate dehydrogenase
MLSRDGVIARFIFAFCFYFLSGTQMVTGGLATVCGVLGTVVLTSALLHYSPLVEFLLIRVEKKINKEIVMPGQGNPPNEGDRNP